MNALGPLVLLVAIIGSAGTSLRRTGLKARTETRQEPFFVSFRITIKDGIDNSVIAKKLSKEINTVGSPEATLFPWSVARVNGTEFPHVALPCPGCRKSHELKLHRKAGDQPVATTQPPCASPSAAPAAAPGPAPGPGPGPAPAPVPGAGPPAPAPAPMGGAPGPAPLTADDMVAATEKAQALSQYAKKLAYENANSLQRLKDRMQKAAFARNVQAHAVADGAPPLWAPTSTTTTTTPPPPPVSIGQLVFDALVNTPPPVADPPPPVPGVLPAAAATPPGYPAAAGYPAAGPATAGYPAAGPATAGYPAATPATAGYPAAAPAAVPTMPMYHAPPPTNLAR